MSVSGFLNRQSNAIVVTSGTLACILTLTPLAARRWEAAVERLAVDACERSGGLPLTARDRVVSCAPKTRPEGTKP